ncbi:MAG: L,D-transpeptidase [Pseudonocardia sp.]|nr:L,D-transpeptidase [Pseudonocardia sp.]
MGRHSRSGRARAVVVAGSLAAVAVGVLVTGPAAQAATTSPAGAASPVPVAGTPCTATAHACVDLARKQAWLITDGAVSRGPVRIEPGDAQDPTPVGTFTVQWKDQNHVSDMPNRAPMPFSVFFADGGVAFHEGSMTNPSYGCVHLQHDDAVAFFNGLAVGDEVQVH